jgi:hypothetical protein
MMKRHSTRHAEYAEPLHTEYAQDGSIRMWRKEEIGVVAIVSDACVKKEVECSSLNE